MIRSPKKIVGVLCAVVVVVGLLAGCGTSGAGGSGAPAGAEPGFPARVEGRFGATTVEARPLRVVAMSWTDADIALALGVRPVGMAAVPEAGGVQPWTRQALGAEQPVTFPVAGQDPIEQVAALAPDLILATKDNNLERSHPQLSRIAPVVSWVTSTNTDPYEVEWTNVATALGVPDRGRDLVARTRAQIAEQRTAHPELGGRTFSYAISPTPQAVSTINSDQDVNSKLLGDLGMRLSPAVTTLPPSSIPNRARLSPERVGVLDADVVVGVGTPAQLAFLAASPVFSQLPAVRRGAFVPLDLADAEALGFPSPLSVSYALGQVVPRLSAAVGAR